MRQSSYKIQPSNSNFFESLLWLLVLVIASLLVIGFVLIIISYPYAPIVDIKSVQVLHFNITSSSLLTACIKIQFSIENPNNKISISVDNIMAHLIYQTKYTVLSTNINPFKLEPSSIVPINAAFDATSMFVNNHVGDYMREELMNFEVVNFDVEIYGYAWSEPGSSWIWDWEKMRVKCEDLIVGFLSNKTGGTILHKPRKCSVGLSFRS